ncbi:hypothetical protein POM88_001639 [Heracleum sosnowskyi]|uniref:Uncharacterized protein n=1 Tax=Heracleum sosnowskyi TaxID=360622 RepID=A0AAD8N9T2_9APIA|nr:hypothetical protein POM88_001639 [Heracleum sosnowskyi]
MKDFYSCKFQVRPNEGMTVRLGGRLFQQYVDAFSTIEQSRLWWNCTGNQPSFLDQKQLQFYALIEIDKLLRSIGKSLKHFPQLPMPPISYLQSGTNNLVLDETSYNLMEMSEEFDMLFKNCNNEQLEVYNALYILWRRMKEVSSLFTVVADVVRRIYGRL